jgi:hypothetical protein
MKTLEWLQVKACNRGRRILIYELLLNLIIWKKTISGLGTLEPFQHLPKEGRKHENICRESRSFSEREREKLESECWAEVLSQQSGASGSDTEVTQDLSNTH